VASRAAVFFISQLASGCQFSGEEIISWLLFFIVGDRPKYATPRKTVRLAIVVAIVNSFHLHIIFP
jgi:hypothetical protein